MKKNLMILAASTMLLFAACNKEEGNGYVINGNKITFGVGVDAPQMDGKQAYYGVDGRIFFTSGDQMFVNNTAYAVMPQTSDQARYSHYTNSWSGLAKVTSEVSENDAYEFIYPASIFNYRNDRYEATFPNQIQLVNPAANNDFSVPPAYVNDNHPIWPMYFNIPDLQQFGGNIVLKNTTAFLCPTFQYTANWASEILAPVATQIAGQDVYYNADNAAPALTLLEGGIMSNIPLYGDAYLNTTTPSAPVMTMLPNSNTSLYNLTFGAAGNVQVFDNPSATHSDQVGLIPVAPTDANAPETKSIKMWAHFTTTIANEVVNVTIITKTGEAAIDLDRNFVYTLFVDMRTTSDVHFVASTDVQGNDVYCTEAEYKTAYQNNGYCVAKFNGNYVMISSANAPSGTMTNFRNQYYHNNNI